MTEFIAGFYVCGAVLFFAKGQSHVGDVNSDEPTRRGKIANWCELTGAALMWPVVCLYIITVA
jgi:hypothetical protein